MVMPIVTINYNGSKDTIELIDSLHRCGEYFDLIIVDNGSEKRGEIETIVSHIVNRYGFEVENKTFETTYTECIYQAVIDSQKVITIIKGKDNYGFSKGTNIGLSYALEKYPDAEYVTILNNDTIVTPNFLNIVISGMKKNDLGAAMGTILYYGYDKPYIWSIGGNINYIKAQGIHIDKGKEYSNTQAECVLRKFISGCFTVFKREALLEIGLLDEDYFFAGEEYQYSVDLSKIYKLGWIPQSVIYHKSKMEEGNGSSHRIKDLCWQYNAYMVKIVFINKNKDLVFRSIWHIIFKIYLNFVIKRKYYKDVEYGIKKFTYMKNWIYKNINKCEFLREDFEEFQLGLKALDA